MRKLCALVLLGLALSVLGSSHAVDTPALIAPTGTGNTTTPTFTWTSPAGSVAFDLWTDSLTSSTLQIIRQTALTGTSYTPATALPDNSVYRAWIRAQDDQGNWSAWSDALTFGVGNASIVAPTAAPTITLPTGAGNTTTPQFSWSAVANADSYEAWVDDKTSGQSQVIHQQVNGTTFTPTTPLTDNHAYAFWVRATNIIGAGAWSSEQDFGLGTAPIVPPTGVPSITAPSGSGNATTVSFTWTAVTGATFYDAWLDNDSTGQSQYLRNTHIVGTSFTPDTPLADNTSYTLWLRAGNDFGYGNWSLAQIFSTGNAPSAPPSSTPTVTAPTSSGNTTTPTFTWTAISGADFYDLWVDSLTDSTSQIIRQTHVTGTSFTPTTALPDNSTYRTWVRAGNFAGFSNWSAAQDFATGNASLVAPTSAPSVTAPTGSGNTTTPTFTWTAVTGADFYDLWVDDLSNSTSQIVRQTHVVGTSYTQTTAIPDNSAFRVWVRGSTVIGAGPWSAAQDFGTGNQMITPPPGAPTITAPTGTGNTTTPTFTWDSVIGATSYDLWVDCLTNSTSQIIRQAQLTDASFSTATPLPDNSAFRTWVRASNVFGPGPWSTSVDFGTGNALITAPTGVPTLIAPLGNGIALTPTFTWSAVDGATLYEFWLDDQTDNTSAFIHQLALPGTSFTPVIPLTPLHSYRWWVRAGTVIGFAPWSAAADFTTTSGLTVTPGQLFVNAAATDGNGAIVIYPPAVVVDGADPSPQVYYSKPSGSLFQLGSLQQVYIIATDKFGNVATTYFWVSVGTISIVMPDMTVQATDANGAVVNFSATVHDLLDPAPQVSYNPPSGSVFPIGSTAVTIIATDSVGQFVQQSFNVIVQAITVTHPDVTIVANSQSGGSTDFASTPPTVIDPFDPAPTISYSLNDFPMGTSRASVYVFDSSGNFASQDFNVTVVSPLTITPPADVFVLSTGNDSAIVNFPDVVVVDVNDPSPFIAYSNFSGDTFPVGTTTVTVTATDPLTFIDATATFNVTVASTFEIVPPADISVQAASPNGVVVSYPQPTVYDPADPNPVLTFSQNSGSVFPLGTTTVTINGTDVLGDTESTSFNVTVNSAITITPPNDVIVPSANVAGMIATYPAATVVDIADPSPVITYSQNSGTLFAPGVTSVTITVTDAANNSQTATFNVIVNTLSVTAPADITVSATAANSAIVNYPAAIVTDPADANPVISYSQNAGTAFPLGTTNVTVNVSDSLGNSATASFNVIVTSPMTIIPPTDIFVDDQTNYVTWPNATVNDALDSSPVVTYSIPNPSYFTIGTTTVYAVATDKFGNSATGSFNVVVTSSLSIIPPAPVFVVATGTSGAVVTYPPATASKPLDTVTLSYSQNSGTLFPVGTTTVNIFAISTFNRSTRGAFFLVTVAPPLAISPPTDISVFATDPNGAVVHYSPASVLDPLDASPVITYSIPNDTEFPIGTSTVNVLATDSNGFTATTSFKITVYPPVSIVPPPDMVVLAADGTGATVNFAAPQVFDTSDPSPIVSYSIPSGSVMPVGNTLVTVTATDAQGISASAYFTVSVVYFTITPPADINVSATDPSGVVVSYPAATINTLTALPITLSYSQISGSLFSLGQNVVTVTGTDGTGDIATATFNVNVHSLTIVPPANVTVEATDPSGTAVSYPPATVTDLFDPNPSVSYSPDSTYLFPLGNTTVTVSAISTSGDTATATFTVTVQDTTPPTIATIPDVPVFNSPTDGAVVYYPPAVVSDNGDSNVTVTYSQNSGTTFPVGTTPVVVTVTDSSGNSTTYMFNVVVSTGGYDSDTTPPVIYNLQPFNGTITNISQPGFSAGYYDGQSGLNLDATIVFLDGVDVTSQCGLSADYFSFFPAAPLDEGAHQFQITVVDNAGNTATASTTITTVYSDPSLTFDNEVNGEIHFPADTVPSFTTPLVDEEFAANGSTVAGSRSVRTRGVTVLPSHSDVSNQVVKPGPATVTGHVSDASGGFTANMAGSFVSLGVLIVFDGQDHRGATFKIVLPSLVPGVEYQVTAVTTDVFGVSHTYYVNVKKDIGTSNLDVQLMTPVDGQVFTSDSVDFAGTMNPAYAIGTTIRVNIDGVQAASASPDQFGNYTATATSVVEGIHTVQVLAITSDNNAAATDKRRITVDKTPPGNVIIDGPNELDKYQQRRVPFLYAAQTPILFYEYPVYFFGTPPPWNAFASPTWFTGTIDDVGTGAVQMDVSLDGTTSSPAFLQPTSKTGRQRWTGPASFDSSYGGGGTGILYGDTGVGPGQSLFCRAQDGAGHGLASDPTMFKPITPNGNVTWLPMLVGPHASPGSISIQKGDSILVGSSEIYSNVVSASGTSYIPGPTPQPTLVDDGHGGFTLLPAFPNAKTLHLGRVDSPYGSSFDARLLKLKYDTPGGYSVSFEDLAKTVVPNPFDPNNPHTYNAGYGFSVNVFDLPMTLTDGSGNPISADDQKNGITAFAESATSTSDFSDPNLIKFHIGRPVGPVSVYGMQGAVNVTVCAPGSAFGGGNARILVSNREGKLVPQGGGPIPMDYINPTNGLDLYVQVTSPSKMPRDIAIVETYTPNFSGRDKTLVNAFWLTAASVDLVARPYSMSQPSGGTEVSVTSPPQPYCQPEVRVDTVTPLTSDLLPVPSPITGELPGANLLVSGQIFDLVAYRTGIPPTVTWKKDDVDPNSPTLADITTTQEVALQSLGQGLFKFTCTVPQGRITIVSRLEITNALGATAIQMLATDYSFSSMTPFFADSFSDTSSTVQYEYKYRVTVPAGVTPTSFQLASGASKIASTLEQINSFPTSSVFETQKPFLFDAHGEFTAVGDSIVTNRAQFAVDLSNGKHFETKGDKTQDEMKNDLEDGGDDGKTIVRLQKIFTPATDWHYVVTGTNWAIVNIRGKFYYIEVANYTISVSVLMNKTTGEPVGDINEVKGKEKASQLIFQYPITYLSFGDPSFQESIEQVNRILRNENFDSAVHAIAASMRTGVDVVRFGISLIPGEGQVFEIVATACDKADGNATSFQVALSLLPAATKLTKLFAATKVGQIAIRPAIKVVNVVKKVGEPAEVLLSDALSVMKDAVGNIGVLDNLMKRSLKFSGAAPRAIEDIFQKFQITGQFTDAAYRSSLVKKLESSFGAGFLSEIRIGTQSRFFVDGTGKAIVEIAATDVTKNQYVILEEIQHAIDKLPPVPAVVKNTKAYAIQNVQLHLQTFENLSNNRVLMGCLTNEEQDGILLAHTYMKDAAAGIHHANLEDFLSMLGWANP